MFKISRLKVTKIALYVGKGKIGAMFKLSINYIE